MALTLDVQVIDEAYGNLKKAVNGDVIEGMTTLAAALQPVAQDAQIYADLLEGAKRVQEVYNTDYKPAVDATLENFSAEIDIANWLQKTADIGSVANAQIDSSIEKIDVDSLV